MALVEPFNHFEAANGKGATVQSVRAKIEANQAKEQSSSSAGGGGSSSQKEVTCPTCGPQAKVKDKSAGKYIVNLNLFFTKTVLRIPKIFDFLPKIKTFDSNKRKGQKCEACQDKKKITDVSDDSSKYQQIAQQAQAAIPQITKQEAKLGLGGTRTTIIQGNDVLQVGALFNHNNTYRMEEKGGVVVKGLEGKQPMPNGATCRKPVPVDGTIAWPSAIGSYTIKCGNVYNLLVGAGGVNVDTKGPINFKGGITTISAPQIVLASEQGPLRIGADSIDITGKHINISPTEGSCYIRGAVHSSGNMVCAGHTHSESVSFVKAACCGTNQTSTMDQGNKDVSQTQAAVWGGMGVKAITTSLLDTQMFYSDVPMDIKNAAFRLISPAELTNTINRLKVLAKMVIPIELMPTGIALGVGNLGYPVLSMVYNYPHTHGLSPMQHTHNTRVPDMDFSADDPEALRGKALNGGTEGNAPGEGVRDSMLKKVHAMMESVCSLFAPIKQIGETISSNIRLS